jgi:hypothetical protein
MRQLEEMTQTELRTEVLKKINYVRSEGHFRNIKKDASLAENRLGLQKQVKKLEVNH